jgi:CheY-like chemotaxis protein
MPPAIRILIVDHNSMGLVARRTVLQELGHCVQTCSSCEDALIECASQKFDVIIADYKLPNMDGIQFIRELRKQDSSVPVILISGLTDTLGLNEACTGADAVLQKSAHEVAHLIRAVNRVSRKAPVKKPAASQGRKPGSKSSGAAS